MVVPRFFSSLWCLIGYICKHHPFKENSVGAHILESPKSRLSAFPLL